MNINDLTIGQAKELAKYFCNNNTTNDIGLNSMIGEKVIVRTYSAGVHFGTLKEKQGSEVILGDSRRVYYWKTNGGISLSEVARTGLHNDSKVCASVEAQWLDVIEIIPCTNKAVESIEAQNDHKA